MSLKQRDDVVLNRLKRGHTHYLHRCPFYEKIATKKCETSSYPILITELIKTHYHRMQSHKKRDKNST